MAENTNQHHDHPLLLQSLKCPRCDSSNTKFCYYNNYSLSQPRHFCKACKRYWTRGGTLRNVPVGGGCRKNKRGRRQTTSGAATAAETTPHHNIAPPQNYNLTTNQTRLNFPFPAFGSARAFPENRGSDFQHQMNGLGFGASDGVYNNHSLCFGSSPFTNSPSVMGTLLASGVQQPDEIGSIQHVSHPQDPCLIWFDPTSMTGSSPSVQSLI